MNALPSRARRCAHVSICALLCLAGAVPAPASGQTAVEYYHALWGHYFITADPGEIDALDRGVLAGWARTREKFPLGGAERVCRFMGSLNGKSTHFYSPYAAECDALLQPAARDVWTFEGWVFNLDLPNPVSGLCRAGRKPLLRLYNDGRSGAPNHRYAVRWGIVERMVESGWIREGFGPHLIFACVPRLVGEGEVPPEVSTWTFVLIDFTSPPLCGIPYWSQVSVRLTTLESGGYRFEYMQPPRDGYIEGPNITLFRETETLARYIGCQGGGGANSETCWDFKFDKPWERTATMEMTSHLPMGCTVKAFHSGTMD